MISHKIPFNCFLRLQRDAGDISVTEYREIVNSGHIHIQKEKLNEIKRSRLALSPNDLKPSLNDLLIEKSERGVLQRRHYICYIYKSYHSDSYYPRLQVIDMVFAFLEDTTNNCFLNNILNSKKVINYFSDNRANLFTYHYAYLEDLCSIIYYEIPNNFIERPIISILYLPEEQSVYTTNSIQLPWVLINDIFGYIHDDSIIRTITKSFCSAFDKANPRFHKKINNLKLIMESTLLAYNSVSINRHLPSNLTKLRIGYTFTKYTPKLICRGKTKKDRPCKKYAIKGRYYCNCHVKQKKLIADPIFTI